MSVGSVSQTHGISRKLVRKVLKQSCFKAYCVTLLQELSKDDFDRHVEFCNIIMNRIDQSHILLDNIVFSDESIFMLNGHVNRRNSRYWNDVNPHCMLECYTQYPQKVNVWTGSTYSNSIIGPFFTDGNLNVSRYAPK